MIDPQTVANSVSAVFACALVPFVFAVFLIVRLTNLVLPRAAGAEG